MIAIDNFKSIESLMKSMLYYSISLRECNDAKKNPLKT